MPFYRYSNLIYFIQH